jgi:hypothetical protein
LDPAESRNLDIASRSVPALSNPRRIESRKPVGSYFSFSSEKIIYKRISHDEITREKGLEDIYRG